MTDSADAARALDQWDSAACGLLRTDGNGLISHVNTTFCEWTGHDRKALVGALRLQDLFTMGGKMFYQTHCSPLLQMQGAIAEVKLEVKRADGQALPMLLNIKRHADAQRTELLIACFGASDRHAYEKELLAARRRSEEALAQQRVIQHELELARARLDLAQRAAEDRALFAEQMVGIVSHDLRNPLSAVDTGVQLLMRTSEEPAQRRILASMKQATDRAHRLIADLLDFTQARLGQGLGVTLRQGNLHDLIARSVAELRMTLPAAVIRHLVQGDGVYRIDADRIQQMVGNLVSNAAAYGALGGVITVTSRGTRDGFTVSVHNLGEPIPPPILSTLFDPMTRGTQANQETRSVGLGLFIVREVARAHGGEVHVSSDSNQGTTFIATFPQQSIRPSL